MHVLDRVPTVRVIEINKTIKFMEDGESEIQAHFEVTVSFNV